MRAPEKPIKKRGYGFGQIKEGGRVFIYAFRCEMFVKVGIAADVERRLRSGQATNPFPITLAYSQEVRAERAGCAEHLAHVALSPAHHHGEWFMCSNHVAQKAITTAIRQAEAEETEEDRTAALETRNIVGRMHALRQQRRRDQGLRIWVR